MIAYIFIAVGVLLLIIYLVKSRSTDSSRPTQPSSPVKNGKTNKSEVSQETSTSSDVKVSKGRLRIFYGSQTGTAAKLAAQLGEQATQNGFQPDVMDIGDLKYEHFSSLNEISIFLMSNTGQGEPPQNAVKFMNVLKGQDSLSEINQVNWSKINFAVFGLGSTQYEQYNVTGINTDKLLQKNGAKRVYALGLGDDNCSLQDDFMQWRKGLWQPLTAFRLANPLQEAAEQVIVRKQSNNDIPLDYISKEQPTLANFKLFFKKDAQDFQWSQQDLDFKTKISLKAQLSTVKGVKQLRQNEKDGSTLQVQIQMPQQQAYQTAGNIAIYSKNDPKIVQQILEYFHIEQNKLDKKIGISLIQQNKKVKLNFVPNTLRTLLQDSIDIQGKLSKSVLKKLSKFASNNQQYFVDNSNIKSTDEFKRITEVQNGQNWYNLIKLIRQHQVKLTFEDFIELSDSVAPRLFTIASHHLTQSNVIVAASIVNNGLISKYFLASPRSIRTELRKSTFTDSMVWKKVIFMAAGTGFAPFRGYLQQKQKRIKQGLSVPIVSLFFGCKHEQGDFIYKNQILGWRDSGVVNKLHLAFSRDTQKKVYIQNLLADSQQELKQLGHCNQTAIYVCGSLPMGHSIVELLTSKFGAEKVKEMQEKGRIVKQLW